MPPKLNSPDFSTLSEVLRLLLPLAGANRTPTSSAEPE